MSETDWLATTTEFDPWDVVIIGGGPAGAVAARQLALDGYRVLLVEKSRQPRFKVCGGCLGGAALDVLQEIGLGDLPLEAGGVTLRKMRLASEGAIVELKLGRRIGLSRQTFDALLVEEAIRAGTRVCAETTGLLEPSTQSQWRSVKLQHGVEEVVVRAKVVLLATGLAACQLDFASHVSPKSRIGLGVVLPQGTEQPGPGVLYMACGSSGYVGITAVEAGKICVAAAVDPAAVAFAGSPGKLVSHILSRSGLPELESLEAAPWRGTPLLTRQTYPMGSHRCLLIGDAATYVEPFTGEGIGWAMRSALLASRLVLEGLEVWDQGTVPRWEKLYQHTLARHQQRCRWITRLLLRNKSLRKLTLWGLRRAPILARPFV